jgi:hypothetical protein
MSTRRRIALLLASIALPAVALTSCGDRQGTSAGTGGSPSGAGGGGGLLWSDDAGIPDASMSCSDAGDGSTGCEGIEGGATYTNDVALILGQNCNGELCHPPPVYDTLVGVVATECCDGRLVVAPGNAAQSYLLDKLEGHDLCAGGRMPLAKPPLADEDVLTVRRWICAGAPLQ